MKNTEKDFMQIAKGVVERATGETISKPEANKSESPKKSKPADKKKKG